MAYYVLPALEPTDEEEGDRGNEECEETCYENRNVEQHVGPSILIPNRHIAEAAPQHIEENHQANFENFRPLWRLKRHIRQAWQF